MQADTTIDGIRTDATLPLASERSFSPARSAAVAAAILMAVALAAAMLLFVFFAAGCATAPRSESERSALTSDTQAFITRARHLDPSLSRFFDGAVGYAAIPEIAKGGLIVGGAYGRGQVFEKGGRLVGYCDVSQGSIGAQIGGQSFGEIIFFETREAFANFKGGQFALAAQASAVALAEGAGAAAKYDNGVAIFILQPKGLMLEASIGGQQFSFQALADLP
jgi:lipid-binding SYLF domain-containing protein